MKDFINILSHARRLNAATKSMSVAELKEVADKLQTVIEKRVEEEAEYLREQEEKQRVIEDLKRQMKEANISAGELIEGGDSEAKPRKKRKPLPAKYAYIDDNGNRQTWTGQGRAPKPIQKALNTGGSKSDFLI
ncbi:MULTISPECIES: H-NS family nucleoid-associated regulatory protein [Gammaproteobacteria]|uniref:H-NS family histone-like protein n=1 Tax=Gammaproteobacteria TaxID=1236 RepID=UPI000DD0BDB7|nr:MULTISPECIES: H-NS family nucleoid-associated regulatory protein [Gammaproteobacteria]RTE87384.1 H-NS histone family protein [Aliidiomarina sp. B3213]TCZ92830.1 H-NS histone family protein [Lysobacter sp. N42]